MSSSKAAATTFFTVEANQPALQADIALAFAPGSPAAEWSPPPDLQHTETIEKGHGRIETRRLETTASITEHLGADWTGLGQICHLTRERIIHGKETTETVYTITSLTAETAGPVRLLDLSREHGGIENKLHYVRDVTWREDQARANAGDAPQALATLRNTVLTIVRRLGFKPVEDFEYFAEYRQAATETVLGRRTE